MPTSGAPPGRSWPHLPASLPRVSKKLQGSPLGVLLGKLRASPVNAFFCPQDLPVASRATPEFWNRTKLKKGAADPKDRGTHFQEHPPSHPSQPACSFLSIWHFQGLPAGPAFKDCNSLLLQRLPGPDKSHRLTAAPSQHPRMCAFLGFFCCCYPGSPTGNKGWDGCLTSWGLNSPPLSPLSSRKLPSKPLLRARQTAGGRERGQMGDWPKTSGPGHRAGPTEVLGRLPGAGRSIDQGSSPKQQAFQGVGLPSDTKGLA